MVALTSYWFETVFDTLNAKAALYAIKGVGAPINR